MNTLEFKGLKGGPSGARSRDLRIKRPDSQGPRKALFSESECAVAGYTQPTVNQDSEKAGFARRFLPISALALRWLDGRAPRVTGTPAPDSNADIVGDALRGWGCP
jgi:hypothetical protein